MLNELMELSRGAEAAGIDLLIRHPDIKDSRKIPTLLVLLDENGDVREIRTKPDEITPWTLRDGMHNSFPFVQLKSPLKRHDFAVDSEFIEQVTDRKNKSQRTVFQKWIAESEADLESHADWPGEGLLMKLEERLPKVAALKSATGKVVPETISRFLKSCRKEGGAADLLTSISKMIVAELGKNSDGSFLGAAIGFLLGKFNAKDSKWENQTGLLFQSADSSKPIYHPKVLAELSVCLNDSERNEVDATQGVCGLTLKTVATIQDKFPQPNLPVMGQTYLFSRNSAAKANTRYGQSSVSLMPVGVEIANSLSAAICALTSPDRSGVTWRAIPGESPNQTDLLVAYVTTAPDAAIVEMVANEIEDFDDEADEFADESGDKTSVTVAGFQVATQRIIDAVKGTVESDFSNSQVNFFVFRKLDPANRKIVFTSTTPVAKLYRAAKDWALGEQNLPSHLGLVAKFGKEKPRLRKPPHVAPLGLIRFSKNLFRSGGMESQDVTGIPASEALELFASVDADSNGATRGRLQRFLRLVLRRRGILCQNAPHLLRKNKLDMLNQNREALRTATILGLLLFKLGRKKEAYMNDTAFRLGQLLAAADVVHVGYCIDMRSGSIPPSLLGNQIFSMAQSSPAKALAVLSRRWKPYDGWAKKLQASQKERARVEGLKSSKSKSDSENGWAIIKALRNWRDMKSVAESLKASLETCDPNDKFRAELLLGFMAGLPPTKKED